jgi:hypothetical protein
MEGLLRHLLLPCLDSDDLFSKFISRIDDYFYCRKSVTRGWLKEKGDFFEYLTLIALQKNCFKSLHIDNAWLLKDLPKKHRHGLDLLKRDVGIDIVASTTKGEWLPIQCKYRKHPKKSTIQTEKGIVHLKWKVPWSDLSTFYTLCKQSGKMFKKYHWDKYVVITNSKGINYGNRTKQDKNIKVVAYSSWCNMKKEHWFAILGDNGNRLGTKIDYSVTLPKVQRIKFVVLPGQWQDYCVEKTDLRIKNIDTTKKLSTQDQAILARMKWLDGLDRTVRS